MQPIHIAGIVLIVGAAAVFWLWPKVQTILANRPAAPTPGRIPTGAPDSIYVPHTPTTGQTLTVEEKAAIEAQDAFKKLKDLEAYFTKVGSLEGLQAICKAGECMFKPPVVPKLNELKKAEPPEFGHAPMA